MPLARCMHKMGYQSCQADPDLWLKEQIDQMGKPYYSYILCYVDNLLVVHHNPKHIMNRINSFLQLKPDSVGQPAMYLGAKLKQRTFKDSTSAWGLAQPSISSKLLRMLIPSSRRTIQRDINANKVR